METAMPFSGKSQARPAPRRRLGTFVQLTFYTYVPSSKQKEDLEEEFMFSILLSGHVLSVCDAQAGSG